MKTFTDNISNFHHYIFPSSLFFYFPVLYEYTDMVCILSMSTHIVWLIPQGNPAIIDYLD